LVGLARELSWRAKEALLAVARAGVSAGNYARALGFFSCVLGVNGRRSNAEFSPLPPRCRYLHRRRRRRHRRRRRPW